MSNSTINLIELVHHNELIQSHIEKNLGKMSHILRDDKTCARGIERCVVPTISDTSCHRAVAGGVSKTGQPALDGYQVECRVELMRRLASFLQVVGHDTVCICSTVQ